MPKPTHIEYTKKYKRNHEHQSLLLPCGWIEVTRFDVPQIKRQFNVFPNMSAKRFLPFDKAKLQKIIRTKNVSRKK